MLRDATRRTLVSFGLIALGWTLFGVASMLVTVIASGIRGAERPFQVDALAIMTSVWFWVAWTFVILHVTARIRSSGVGWPMAVALHAVTFLGIHVLDSAADYGRAHLLLEGRTTLLQTFVLQISLNVLLYGTVVLAEQVVASQRVARDRQIAASLLEARLAGAELSALRTQLQPHFLFNTLHTISEMVHRDPDKADLMVTRLGTLLRASLDYAEKPSTTLGDELRILDLYLDIQRARHGDALKVQIAADPGVLDLSVPSLVLQPLVENAIRHGLGPGKPEIEVVVSARREGSELRIEVLDSGRGVTATAKEKGGRGVGIRGVQAALRGAYGDGDWLTLSDREGGGTCVSLRSPPARGSGACSPGTRTSRSSGSARVA